MAAPRRVVREIPSIAILQQVVAPTEALLLVAAYARVSTEKEEQEDSFERQVEHYTQMIRANKKWKYVDIYADPGISGTRAEKRPDFLRMINDCRAGKIQKILVKSISRFARNTVDALNYIRELKDLGISVYFESENIDTLTPGGEVLITILAAMAEQESRTISTNIKWAYQRKFQKGEIILNTGLMLGYKKEPYKDENGLTVYSVIEEEAVVIRRIFREYAAGMTPARIASGLNDDGIPTKKGRNGWLPSVIKSILVNEKYTGNAVLGKTYKPDVLSKKRMPNDGSQAPMYYAENTHPAIIEKELFDLVQKEIQRRKDCKDAVTGTTRYTSKYPFSGLLVCATCGSRLRRHVRTVGSGKRVPSWACCTRILHGRTVCDSHHIREDVLERTYLAAIQKMVDDAAEVIATVREGAMLAMEPENAAKLEAVDREILATQEQMLAMHKQFTAQRISAEAYNEAVRAASVKIQELEEQREELETVATRYAEVKVWLDAFEESTRTGQIMTATDAVIMKMLVEEILVDDYGIEVKFKCGASVEQEYLK